MGGDQRSFLHHNAARDAARRVNPLDTAIRQKDCPDSIHLRGPTQNLRLRFLAVEFGFAPRLLPSRFLVRRLRARLRAQAAISVSAFRLCLGVVPRRSPFGPFRHARFSSWGARCSVQLHHAAADPRRAGAAPCPRLRVAHALCDPREILRVALHGAAPGYANASYRHVALRHGLAALSGLACSSVGSLSRARGSGNARAGSHLLYTGSQLLGGVEEPAAVPKDHCATSPATMSPLTAGICARSQSAAHGFREGKQHCWRDGPARSSASHP